MPHGLLAYLVRRAKSGTKHPRLPRKAISFPSSPRAFRRLPSSTSRIAITATLPLGSLGFERHPAGDGQRLVWLEPHLLNKLRAQRRPGESYSDVIIRLASETPLQSAPDNGRVC